MRGFLIALLLLIAAASQAADFEVTSLRGGEYVIAATGEIQPGDAQQLRDIFVGKNAFPVATRINTQGGSLEEAMALGELYRSASLATLADTGCDTACFLWLASGASRAANGDITLDRAALKQRAVKRYLSDMDVSKATQKSWRKDNATVITWASFDQVLGERPASIKRWLEASCGKQSEADREKLYALQAESFLQALQRLAAKSEDDSKLTPIIERYTELAAKAEGIDDAGRQALQEQWFKLRACKQSYIAERQRDALAGLAQRVSADATKD